MRRRHRLFVAVFLLEGEQAAADDDDDDDGVSDACHALARTADFGSEGERRANPENDREELEELLEQTQGSTYAAEPLYAVRSIFPEPPLRFLRTEPVMPASEPGQYLVGPQDNDGGRGRAWGLARLHQVIFPPIGGSCS